jgi:HEPN superfamily RES-like protein
MTGVRCEWTLEFVVDGLRHEYEDPVEQMAWDGGYVGIVHEAWDLLWDLDITESEAVHETRQGAIETTQWCQRDPYAATPTQALAWGWAAFREFVKHRWRATFLATDHSTTDGRAHFRCAPMPAAIARAVAEANLVQELPAGSDWWRVRPHLSTESYSTAADLGTPPDAVARDNRMTLWRVRELVAASAGSETTLSIIGAG